MIYGFDTENENAAIAALCVYVVWRSRDRGRVKITPEIWAQVERWTKDAAYYATTIFEMIEKLKEPGRLYAPTLRPRYLELGLKGEAPLVAVIDDKGRFSHAIRFGADREIGIREFGTRVFERADQKGVLAAAFRTTTRVILLVRDRIEREKPIEAQIETALIEEEA